MLTRLVFLALSGENSWAGKISLRQERNAHLLELTLNPLEKYHRAKYL